MGYFSLSDSVNNCSDYLINSYCFSFIRNPIIAGFVVTFITIAIYHYSASKDNYKRIFVCSSALNICVLFFHATALTKFIEGKDRSNKMTERFNAIQGGGDDVGTEEKFTIDSISKEDLTNNKKDN